MNTDVSIFRCTGSKSNSMRIVADDAGNWHVLIGIGIRSLHLIKFQSDFSSRYPLHFCLKVLHKVSKVTKIDALSILANSDKLPLKVPEFRSHILPISSNPPNIFQNFLPSTFIR